VTLAAFQITKPNGELNGTTYSVGGEQRIRGAQLEMFGAITPDVRVVGGVTVLDGKVTKTANAAIRGKTPIGVAPVQASVGGEWDLPGLKD
ncbi:TonB-dependent siderophore receptor, partial [Acinetobacter baumannii]